jgi:hypothetical protein
MFMSDSSPSHKKMSLLNGSRYSPFHHSLKFSDTSQSLAKHGIPLSLTTIGSYAAEIYGVPLGVTWPTCFKKRHPDLKVKVRVTNHCELKY